jgi:hypothetical protein
LLSASWRKKKCGVEMDWPKLLENVRAFSLDDESVRFPFSARLAREQGWAVAYAARVGDEYKRFMMLAVAAGHSVTPSEDVDAAWHLHLIYTRNYWHAWCRDVLGKDIHHEPTVGGSKEGEKFHDWYAATLRSYREFFGEAPPSDIWPDPDQRFAAMTQRWVSREKHWIIPRPQYVWKTLYSLIRGL